MALFSQILHTYVLNKDTHFDHVWCLISKYTEYDNIFINYRVVLSYKELLWVSWTYWELCYCYREVLARVIKRPI